MSHLTNALKQMNRENTVWSAVLLGLRPEVGERAILDQGRITFPVPEGFAPRTEYLCLPILYQPLQMIIHAALDIPADRAALVQEGFSETALRGFDKLAHVLVTLAQMRVSRIRWNQDLPNIVYQDTSFRRWVDQAGSVQDLKGIALAAARDTGERVLSVFATSLEINAPEWEIHPECLPHHITSLPFETDPDDMQDTLECARQSLSGILGSDDLAKLSGPLSAFQKRARKLTAIPLLDVIALIVANKEAPAESTLCLDIVVEAILGTSFERGFTMAPDFNASYQAYMHQRPSFMS